jgi:probable F420-dependent oxidoreductase
VTVRIGMGPGLGAGLSAQEYWQWIDLCERVGIDSVWHSDQLLGQTLEPVTMLAALAGRTNRMRFGTSAIVAPFRDPVVLAKEFATIDYLSGGRLLPVLGVGNASDAYWAATGTPTAGRGSKTDEMIKLIRLLLEQAEVAFEGQHYRYHGTGLHPRPAKPVPLWIGGNTQAAFTRTALLGDGWLGSMIGPAQAGEARASIEAGLRTSGRTIDPDHYGMTLMMRLGDKDDPAMVQALERLSARMPPETRHSAADMVVAGTPTAAIATLRRYVDAGMSKFVLIPMAQDSTELLRQTELLAAEVLPAIETRR